LGNNSDEIALGKVGLLLLRDGGIAVVEVPVFDAFDIAVWRLGQCFERTASKNKIV